MQEQVRNRDWVKNAAIIFLVVLLVLTFFSNTIMNRSLPEVATQEVDSGSIVARVRGTGTVQANSNTQVKMDRTRVIRSVLVKVGQKVEAGDVLFTLGEGASEEIDAAEETLRNLQASYNRTAATVPEYNYTTDSRKIGILAEKLREAESAMKNAKEKMEASVVSDENLKIIQGELERAVAARKAAEANYHKETEDLQDWKTRQESILPEMVDHGMLDGDLIGNSGYDDRNRIEIQISRVGEQYDNAKYTVTFKNDNGDTLQTSTLSKNDVPIYSGGIPTSSKDTATETYPFIGWFDSDGGSITPVTKDVTYTAKYSDTPETKPANTGDSTSDVDTTVTEGDAGTGTGETTDLDVTGSGLSVANSEADYSEENNQLTVTGDISGIESNNGIVLSGDEQNNLTETITLNDPYKAKAEEQTSPQTGTAAQPFDLEKEYYLGPLHSNHSEWQANSGDWLVCLEFCLDEYDKCQNEIFNRQTSSVEEYEAALEAEIKWSNLYDEYMQTLTPEGANYQARYEAYRTAKDNYDTAVEALHDKKANNETTLAGYNADLANLWGQIQRAQKKLDDLLGGEEATVTAKVAGTIQTLDASPGDTKKKDDVIATIEAPDMGYTLSFSVTNDQANRLRVGDTATVSNFYWGSEITATLTSIKIDQKNPQTNKILTFDLNGNVTSGTELTLSVGQKSANYDVIIPSSSVRTDANGTYVLKLESKNSPLGNRYLARRVPVEVLAVDDTNTAVSAELGYGDYVITSSSSPLKNGELVRLATSA